MKKIDSFLTPDVIKGLSSLLDLGTTGVKTTKIGGFYEDGVALRKDWNTVGKDIWGAIDEYKKTDYSRQGSRR